MNSVFIVFMGVAAIARATALKELEEGRIDFATRGEGKFD